MTDNNGTKRRRPTPSKAAARTASATASSPLTKAAKSRTNALAYRSRPDSVGPDPIPSIDRYCRADGYRRDLAWSATSQIPFCGKTPFELSSINRVPQPEASRATPNRGRPGIMCVLRGRQIGLGGRQGPIVARRANLPCRPGVQFGGVLEQRNHNSVAGVTSCSVPSRQVLNRLRNLARAFHAVLSGMGPCYRIG